MKTLKATPRDLLICFPFKHIVLTIHIYLFIKKKKKKGSAGIIHYLLTNEKKKVVFKSSKYEKRPKEF